MKYEDLSEQAKENAIQNVAERYVNIENYYYYTIDYLKSSLEKFDLNNVSVDINRENAEKIDVSFSETPVNDDIVHMIHSYGGEFGSETKFFTTLDLDNDGNLKDGNLDDFLKEYCSVSFDSFDGAKFYCDVDFNKSNEFDEFKHQCVRAIEDWMSDVITEAEEDIATAIEESINTAYEKAEKDVNHYEFDENGNVIN